MTTETQPLATEPSAERQQYSVASILWMTTAVALLMNHARGLGPQSMQLLLACAVFWLVSSLVFSWISRDVKEVCYWTALIVVQAFLAVSVVRGFSLSQACGWGLVGAVCGGFCAAKVIQAKWLGSLVSGGLGGLSMISTLWCFGETLDMELWLDLIGAGCVGFMLWHFIDFMRWFRTASGQPHLVMAAWLTLSVLAGNWLVTLSGY